MKANPMCMSCLLEKQVSIIQQFDDEERKAEYIHQILKILYERGLEESAPSLCVPIVKFCKDFWGYEEDFTEIKHLYNRLLLGKEAEIEEKICGCKEPLKECIKYVCAGNYIDFGAVDNVNEAAFEKLLAKAERERVPEATYERFLEDLRKAKELVYLTDNCGEIVLDKIFVRHIRETFPHLSVTVIVRGEDAGNDATMEDAKEVGMTEEAFTIGNGNSAPGTVWERLSVQAKEVMQNADVIISKGQGNLESLYGEGWNPYFMFLCKCELFVERFGLEQYASVFKKEDEI